MLFIALGYILLKTVIELLKQNRSCNKLLINSLPSKTGWAKPQKWLGQKLHRPINWMGQTLNWVCQYPAGSPVVPLPSRPIHSAATV